MTPAHRAEYFHQLTDGLTFAQGGVPSPVFFRLGREIAAGADNGTLLTVADHARQAADHLAILGDDRGATAWRRLADALVRITEKP